MLTAGFGEPMTFSLRASRLVRGRLGQYDVVHDNQSLGYGMLGPSRLGVPLVTTIHHPIHIDRKVELANATGWRRLSLRRWYGFTRMQRRVARRLKCVITVSESSRAEILDHLGVADHHIDVVPVGTDIDRFTPDPAVARVPGRVVTTASADVPLKGLLPLVQAVAKVRTERHVELVVVGSTRPRGPVAEAITRYSLPVRFTGRISEDDLLHELRSAELAVVPSLFEGFSLPLVEAMACGTPVVATTGGALPEVAGADGETALLVPPGDPQALAAGIGRALDDTALRTGSASPGANAWWLVTHGARPPLVPPMSTAARSETRAQGGPLLTGCSSMYHALRCALALADDRGEPQPDWELAAATLGHAVAAHPERFAPRERYSMDWYYPILGGATARGGGAPTPGSGLGYVRRGGTGRTLRQRPAVGYRRRDVRVGPCALRHWGARAGGGRVRRHATPAPRRRLVLDRLRVHGRCALAGGAYDVDGRRGPARRRVLAGEPVTSAVFGGSTLPVGPDETVLACDDDACAAQGP